MASYIPMQVQVQVQSSAGAQSVTWQNSKMVGIHGVREYGKKKSTERFRPFIILAKPQNLSTTKLIKVQLKRVY